MRGATQSLCELYDRVSTILQRFRARGIVVHRGKCVYGLTEIEFLGHRVSALGLQLGDSKRAGLLALVPPSDKSSLKSFLGLANYFRDFVPNYSQRASVLFDLVSIRASFVWDVVHQAAFDDIKAAVASAPMLFHMDYSLPVVLRTDASTVGVGAVLLNVHRDVERPICFLSHRFSGPATRWSTIDQEAFAVFFAITRLSHYLRGHPFVVETDHANLVYLQHATSGRVGRWRLALQEFDFVVHHIPGTTNVVADALSRCCAVVPDVPITVEHSAILERFHNDVVGHNGIGTTIRMLFASENRWDTLRADVVKFIHACPLCQKQRQTVVDTSVVSRHVIECYEPFQEVSIDSIVDLPEDSAHHTAILVIIDNFTRFVELFAVSDLSAPTAAQCLLSVVGRYGMVEYVRSDRGGQFVAELFTQLIRLMGCRQVLTIGYRPSANGIVERANAEIIRHLSAIVHSRRVKSHWSFALPIVQRILNAHVHSSTGARPADLLFGIRLNLDRGILCPMSPSESTVMHSYVSRMYRYQLDAIQASQLHLASVMDTRVVDNPIVPKQFPIGSYVLTSAPVSAATVDKFSFRYRGPFLVQNVSGNTYSCLDLRTRLVHQFDVSTLHGYDVGPDVDPTEIAALDADEDVVDSIVDHRAPSRRKKDLSFLVRFKDGTEHWLPYLEVRRLAAFQVYLDTHADFAVMFKF